jgi:hypothetical protein
MDFNGSASSWEGYAAGGEPERIPPTEFEGT